ncbi:MAG: nitrogenase molybdenum-iron protein, alpha and beta chain [Gracilibacteraceae bacterium]|jgi:nitrogenase molybdenum-iron protein beta chain|nr:nitrogenase molybdenum-iron protein, alpha and beta chain [Gracilibacteraceae bacterium]
MSGCEMIEQSRTTCALGGMYTALAMERVLPVLHCGPGCQAQARSLLGTINGAQSAVPFQESVIPCSNFGETDVIFGGADRLRTLIEHTQAAYQADLLIVFSGCTPEIIGDDTASVVSSFAASRTPVLFAETAGFRGNNLYGHAQLWTAICDQYLRPRGAEAVIPGLVNVFGIVPFYDPFWSAQLEELALLLRSVGLKPNIFYGRGKGLPEVDKIPRAEFNLLLSPWVDLPLVRRLREQYGTPYLHYPAVPLGPTETSRFLRALTDFAALSPARTEAVIREGEAQYYYYLNRNLQWLYTCRVLPKYFLVNASAAAALSLTRYLVNDLGLIPDKIYLPENVPEKNRSQVEGYFRDTELNKGVAGFPVIFTEDGGLMAAEFGDRLFDPGTLAVFGSFWDVLFCRERRIPFLSVTTPQGNRAFGVRHYCGFSGGINFFTDYFAVLAELGPFGM